MNLESSLENETFLKQEAGCFYSKARHCSRKDTIAKVIDEEWNGGIVNNGEDSGWMDGGIEK